ncbi:MAG: GNAT family N-acetyltransferase [Saprospiraceae bacterium]
MKIAGELILKPLSPDLWEDFELLFGQKGACGQCWCMNYRCSKAEFDKGKIDQGNKLAMKTAVWQNEHTGVLGFIDDVAVAWLAFAPREEFPRLAKSRIHKRIDDLPVWSIPCFYIHKQYRGKGISVQMLLKLIEYARELGISVLEAYPTIPTQGRLPDTFAWIGLYRTFEKAGFEIVDRTSVNRPMVRYYLK